MPGTINAKVFIWVGIWVGELGVRVGAIRKALHFRAWNQLRRSKVN